MNHKVNSFIVLLHNKLKTMLPKVLLIAVIFTILVNIFYMKLYEDVRFQYGFKIAIGISAFFYVLLPILFYFVPVVSRHLVFQHYVNRTKDVDFSNPESEGIFGARNLYLNTEPGISIGVWHILPLSLIPQKTKPSNHPCDDHGYWEESLRNSGKTVVVYLHGNTGSRALPHRRELYCLLQKLECHVITCDYRGYGDSTQVSPSESGVVADATAVYKWTRRLLGKDSRTPLFVWGHSLGSGISTHTVANLCAEGDAPNGLFLESAFTSIADGVKCNSKAAIYRFLPGFSTMVDKALSRHGIYFHNETHLRNIHIPVSLIHAEDDHVIPFQMGNKLFQTCKNSRSGNPKPEPVYFVNVGTGYEHKFACRASSLPEFIQKFIQNHSLDRNILFEKEVLVMSYSRLG